MLGSAGRARTYRDACSMLPGYPSAGQREPESHVVRNCAGMLRRPHICGAKISILLNGVE